MSQKQSSTTNKMMQEMKKLQDENVKLQEEKKLHLKTMSSVKGEMSMLKL